MTVMITRFRNIFFLKHNSFWDIHRGEGMTGDLYTKIHTNLLETHFSNSGRLLSAPTF